MPRLHDGCDVTEKLAEVDPVEAQPCEVPALAAEDLAHLEEDLHRDPKATVRVLRESVDANLPAKDAEIALKEAEAALEHPEEAAAALAHTWGGDVDTLPDFTFPGRDPDAIPIDHRARKFETHADVLGWVLLSTPGIVAQRIHGRFTRARFAWHDAHEGAFVYALPTPPITVALFGDFGSGYYHARHIAKQLAHDRPAAAVHLGDTYYAGRRAEFEAYVERPLVPLLGEVPLFLLVGNHELYSGAHPYVRYLREKRKAHPETQRQEGSYFCLRTGGTQLVAAETEWWGRGRLGPPRLAAWVRERLREGRDGGLVNVLLTSYHPYMYGTESPSPLFHAMDDLVGLVDVWAWGNTHYAAIFDRSDAYPFIGACLGHSGYPFDRTAPGARVPAPLRWLETGARFPEETGLRPDRGLNGFAYLDLGADGPTALRFVDWMGRTRCVARLVRTRDGVRLGEVTAG